MSESPFRKAAMKQLADLLLPTIPESFQDLGQRAAGRAEVLATLGTGVASSIPAGYGGLLELARTGDPQAAAQLTQEIQQGLTYMPRTGAGQEYLQDISGPLEMLATPSEAVGQATLEATGSPLAAAGAETFADPLEYMLPGLKGVMATAPLIRRARTAVGKASDIDSSIKLDLGVEDARVDEIAEKAIRAYHASPYDFNEFDRQFMGSGEGAQMYGYGFYSAQDPDSARPFRENRDNQLIEMLNRDINNIANELQQFEVDGTGNYTDPRAIELSEQYAELLNRRQAELDPDPAMRINGKDLNDMYSKLTGPKATNLDYEKAEILEQIMIDGDLLGVIQRQDEFGQFSDRAFDWFKKEVEPKFTRRGRLYELNIKASDEDLIDWNLPVNEQPQKIKDKLLEAGIKETTGGKNAYYSLASEATGADAQKEATRAAESMGIKGIKYEDPHSAAGVKNYVIFDPTIIDIAKKYGVAIPVAGAILMQSEQESMAKNQPIE